ncbi:MULTISPECIES: sugar kinase [Actinomadura]|uniref:Sugar kinase n=1 Tax=Actinomadura yumaensis TaxID=111807 RepID=A0ABW2CEQ9_9ACTN|nr:sugar kinase [Actinomadura sp. J1-007]MWK38376.1 sugar kinase [Actinomadura sp. J1-007]
MTVVAVGESLGLLRAEESGSLATVDRLRLTFGGAESNVAIGVSRLGGSARWIGRVGRDVIGDRIVRELRAEGVEVHAGIDADRPTALMLKESPVPAMSRVLYYRGDSAGSRLGPADIPAGLVQANDVLHVSGITASLSASAEKAVHHAIDIARANDALVSFDVNHRATLRRHRAAADIYREVAQRADIIFAGLDEASLLTGAAATAEATARELGRIGAGQIVVKLGADGCLALEGGELHARSAVPVDPVDTVGAGDAFVAGYLAELQLGGSMDARLATAVTAGAFACLSTGDWEGLPRRGDLDLLGAVDPVMR